MAELAGLVHFGHKNAAQFYQLSGESLGFRNEKDKRMLLTRDSIAYLSTSGVDIPYGLPRS